MSPTRYSSLFRNRWTALFWAAGICWSAVEFTGCTDLGASDPTATENGSVANTSDSDAEALSNLQTLVGELEK